MNSCECKKINETLTRKPKCVDVFLNTNFTLFYLVVVIVLFSLTPQSYANQGGKVLSFFRGCNDALNRVQENEQHLKLIEKLEMLVKDPEIRAFYYKEALSFVAYGEVIDENHFNSRFSTSGIRQYWKALSLADRDIFINQVLPSTKVIRTGPGNRLQMSFSFHWLGARSRDFSLEVALKQALSSRHITDIYIAKESIRNLPGIDYAHAVAWDSTNQKDLYKYMHELVLALPATDGGVNRTLDFLAAIHRLYSDSDAPNVNIDLNTDLRIIGQMTDEKETFKALLKYYSPFFKFINLKRWTGEKMDFGNRLLLRASQFPPIREALERLVASSLLFLGSNLDLPVDEVTRLLLRPLVFVKSESLRNAGHATNFTNFIKGMSFSISNPDSLADDLMDHIRKQLLSLYIIGEYYYQLSLKASHPEYTIHIFFREFNPGSLEKPLATLKAIAFHTLLNPMWAVLQMDSDSSAILARLSIDSFEFSKLLVQFYNRLFPNSPMAISTEIQNTALVVEMRNELVKVTKKTLGFDKEKWLREFRDLTKINPFGQRWW
ncbi:MAG: hypothetical protein H6625_07510 [Bdellovibrionaceae bacterium]|nr:hypothetical protein [Pseudobdellovibrionaceae bacterium]